MIRAWKAENQKRTGKDPGGGQGKAEKVIADSQQLDMNRSGTQTVKRWVKMWYGVYTGPRLWEKTKGYYLNCVHNHINPELGDIRLDKLTIIQIQKLE